MAYKSHSIPKPLKTYELNILNVYDWSVPGNLADYFEMLLNLNESFSSGALNIAEFGVHQGRATLATSLFLKTLGRDSTIFAYDSWEGFPDSAVASLDGEEGWKYLLDKNLITEQFLKDKNKVKRLYSLRKGQQLKTLNAENLSLSGNFSNTSLSNLKEKAKFLDIDNIHFIQGDFSSTLNSSSQLPPKPLHGVLMDCDLFNSYATVLPKIWPLLEIGGQIYLDEYFSYKFPGARIATDQFLATLNKNHFSLEKISENGDFERYILQKQGSAENL